MRLASWQIGSEEEARAAADAGCDFIIAQGIEAGGHVRGQIGLLALLDAVLSAVDVPVLAAGGIGTGRALAAVLAAGADGARIGTRFVAAEEAEAHPRYVEALIAAGPSDTVRSDTFALDYPGAPHRALRSSVAAAQAFQGDVVGEVLSPSDGDRVPVRRFQKLTITRHVSGAIEAMPHWAGESVRGVTRVQPAAEIVRELAGEAERLLRRWGPEDGPSTGPEIRGEERVPTCPGDPESSPLPARRERVLEESGVTVGPARGSRPSANSATCLSSSSSSLETAEARL